MRHNDGDIIGIETRLAWRHQSRLFGPQHALLDRARTHAKNSRQRPPTQCAVARTAMPEQLRVLEDCFDVLNIHTRLRIAEQRAASRYRGSDGRQAIIHLVRPGSLGPRDMLHCRVEHPVPNAYAEVGRKVGKRALLVVAAEKRLGSGRNEACGRS